LISIFFFLHRRRLESNCLHFIAVIEISHFFIFLAALNIVCIKKRFPTFVSQKGKKARSVPPLVMLQGNGDVAKRIFFVETLLQETGHGAVITVLYDNRCRPGLRELTFESLKIVSESVRS